MGAEHVDKQVNIENVDASLVKVDASLLKVDVPKELVTTLSEAQSTFIDRLSRGFARYVAPFIAPASEFVSDYMARKAAGERSKRAIESVENARALMRAGLESDDQEVGEVADRAARLHVEQTLWQYNNVDETVRRAIPHVTREMPDQEPSDEFKGKFVDAVRNRSEPEIQEYFGRLLAGEYQQPGSFSLRTIATLESMSPRDAQLFMGACLSSFCIDEDPRKGRNLPRVRGVPCGDVVSFDDLLHLVDIGLMLPKEIAWGNPARDPSKGASALLFYRPIILGVTSKPGESCLIASYAFTQAGRELSCLVDNPSHRGCIRAMIEANRALWFQAVESVGVKGSDYRTQAKQDYLFGLLGP